MYHKKSRYQHLSLQTLRLPYLWETNYSRCSWLRIMCNVDLLSAATTACRQTEIKLITCQNITPLQCHTLTVPQIMCRHATLHNAATQFTLHHKSAFLYNAKITKKMYYLNTHNVWQLVVNTISVYYSIVFKLPLFAYCVISNTFRPALGQCHGYHSLTVLVITAGIP